VLPGVKEEPESLTAESADEVENVLIELLGFFHVQEVPSSHHHHLSGIWHGLIEQIGDLETRRDVALGRQATGPSMGYDRRSGQGGERRGGRL
jgi:hypothetical protein